MRDYSISYIRMIATIAIVFCHIAQYLDLEIAFWLNLGVQIFLFVSGYLYGKKEIEKPVKWFVKNYFKIMVPFWIVIIIVSCIDVFVLKRELSLALMLRNLVGLQGFATIPNMAHTWFITYILICYAITPILEKGKPFFEGKHLILKLLILFVIMAFVDYFISLPIFCCYIACYIAGYYISFNHVLENEDKEVSIWIIVTALFLVLRLFVQYHENFVWNESLELLILNWNHSMVGITIFMVLYKVLYKMNVTKNAILAFFDIYSYDIYLVHQIFILGELSLMALSDVVVLNIAVILVIIIFVARLLHTISSIIFKKLYTLV